MAFYLKTGQSRVGSLRKSANSFFLHEDMGFDDKITRQSTHCMGRNRSGWLFPCRLNLPSVINVGEVETLLKAELEPREEARYLLSLFEQSMPACIKMVHDQFNVIQARAQFLLTLGTLTLTITGFSGPKIAETNLFSRYSIAIGIFLVLLSMLMMLLGTNKIRWVTQARDDTPELTLTAILRYRNRKTRYYRVELYLLVVGLACYVASIISFLLYFKSQT